MSNSPTAARCVHGKRKGGRCRACEADAAKLKPAKKS